MKTFSTLKAAHKFQDQCIKEYGRLTFVIDFAKKSNDLKVLMLIKPKLLLKVKNLIQFFLLKLYLGLLLTNLLFLVLGQLLQEQDLLLLNMGHNNYLIPFVLVSKDKGIVLE